MDDPSLSEILLRLVGHQLAWAEAQRQPLWHLAAISLGASLVGAGAALGGIWIADHFRRKERNAEAAAALISKFNVITNGLWGVHQYLRAGIANAGDAPREEWWKYINETIGFLPPPEPLGGRELELLAKHGEASLFSDLSEIENSNRIVFQSMQKYGEIRRSLHELVAPYTNFRRTDQGMVAETNFRREDAPLAPALAYDCESLIIENINMLERVLPQLKRAAEKLNSLFKRHRKSWGIGLHIETPQATEAAN
ncbi:hypothetical protein [Marinicauda sp. Alg238-R41]|uniref:hypothetical protein n=1 Tax=Marinicauda sp. Alg238-R41 TaxID=2993447 RepID=UPI0022E3B269|nr:hypothetical protein [Marinicauda sp. Alg238-R41]